MLNHANVIMQKSRKKMFFSFLCACHCAKDVPFSERLNKLLLCSLKEQKRWGGKHDNNVRICTRL